MWHVGIHIIDVPPNDIEPNYDEYHQVRILQSDQFMCLIALDPPRIQSPQHTYPPTRKSVDHTPPPPSRLGHRMDEKDPLRNTHIYRRKRADSVVPVHIHLPATDREYMEPTDLWWTTLHGPTSNGRDVNLGYLCEPAYGSFDIPNPLHHCSSHDECETAITAGSASGFHLELSVSSHRCIFTRPSLMLY
jgi:hypothetical protein